MKEFTCSWCGRETAGAVGEPVFCPGCSHRADLCAIDCDCPACRASDPGFLVYRTADERFVAGIDPQSGRKRYTAEVSRARVFRTAAWRRAWNQPGYTIVPVPAAAGEAA